MENQAIVLAVAHDEFMQLGIDGIHALGLNNMYFMILNRCCRLMKWMLGCKL